MINMYIDLKNSQSTEFLLPARQKSNNYLELSKENIFGNMTPSH